MVPVDRLVIVVEGCTPDEIERLVAKTGFSRFPVADAHGELVGYLHSRTSSTRAARTGSGLCRRGACARSRRPSRATRSRTRCARCSSRGAPRPGGRGARWPGADEDLPDAAAPARGHGALGVVFLEDILEELVGEVRDAMQRRVH
ncbi:hypothetical protein NKG05_21595 [Oerskovia sp. M15]